MIRPQPEVYADLERRALLDVRAENIPGELKARPQWVNYKAIQKPDGRLDKVPYTPGADRKASTTDLMTWGTFEEALEGLDRFDGLGFVFCSADPYVGVDLDGCVYPETGEIEPWARQIIEDLDAYAELSPSGTGVHIIAKGRIPCSGRRGSVEMYIQDRFFAMTGHVIGESA
jgi:primase-polymerase (primpol)-like protein